MRSVDLAYHIPAMLNESIEGLNIKPSGVYVDATFGGGGHSRAILGALNEDGTLYGFDQDYDAEKNMIEDKRFTFVRSNFRYLPNFMRYYGVKYADGILADLGVSSHHFDDEQRGFSFRLEGDLDMRMNRRDGKTALEVLNSYSEEQLADVLFFFGELRQARKIAHSIVRGREIKQIKTTSDFVEILKPFYGKEGEKKFLAQTFQAIRIEVNDELSALQDFLKQSEKLLCKNGRIAVITYHSLEDRLVKNFFKTGNMEGRLEKDIYGNFIAPLKPVGKMMTPANEEISINSRARSAKLRVAEKINLK